MDTPDSLTLLRKYARERKGRMESGKIIIDQWMIEPKATTNYKGRTGFLTNETIFFFINHMDEKHGEYMKKARQAGVPFVARIERATLQQYLTGEINETDAIDPTAPTHLAMPADLAPSAPAAAGERAAEVPARGEAPSAKRTAAEGEGEAGAKRARQEGAAGAAADKEVAANEATGTLPRDKLAELKAKRAQHKTAVATGKDARGRKDKAGAVPLKASQETRNILKNELVFQTRTTVLKAKGRSFLNVLKATRNGGKAVNGSAKHKAENQKQQQQPQQQQPVYQRFDQPVTQPELPFKVNVHGTDAAYEPGTIYKEEKPKEQPRPQAEQKPARKKRSSKTPIILVPGGATAKITLRNAKPFLEEGRYLLPAEARKEQKTPPTNLYVYRQRPTGTVAYHIIDNVARLSQDDWKRVVAVVVAGPKWQFKDFPEIKAGKKPVDIFSKYRAFYISFKDEKVHPNVKDWDCKILQLSRSQRHLDQTASKKFWETLDMWTAGRFPHLRL